MTSEVGAQSSIGSLEYRIKTKIETETEKTKKTKFWFLLDGEGSRTGQNLCSGFLCFLFLVFFYF